jgi:hypothetical protein
MSAWSGGLLSSGPCKGGGAGSPESSKAGRSTRTHRLRSRIQSRAGREFGDLMATREGLRVIATLIGGGLLAYAVLVVARGTLYDVDDGRVDRSARPVTFWLLVGGITLLGWSILGVGWEWPLVNAVGRLLDPR